MDRRKVKSVFLKELKETLRDRRTLMVMILVPILLYPVLFSVMGQIMTVGIHQLENEDSRIALMTSFPAGLDNLIRDGEDLIVQALEDPLNALKENRIHACVEFVPGPLQDSLFVYFDGAVDRSRLARSRLEELFSQYQKETRSQYLRRLGVGETDIEPFGLRSKNTAPPSKMGGMFLGSIIPLLLIVTLVLGAMYPAIDLTAGEKERGTMETILSVPIHRLELLAGKYLTVTTIALITGVLNLVSMTLAYALGFIQMEMITGNLTFSFSPGIFIILLLVIVPLSMFVSAVILSVCLFARSFKDAQNLITPLYLLMLFPALFVSAPGIELKGILVFVPILNICLLFKEILLHNFVFESIFLVLLSTTAYALLAIVIFSKLYHAEQILFAEGRGWALTFKRSQIVPVRAFQPSSALLMYAILMLFLFYLGSVVQIRYRHWGILITEWVLIFLPVLLTMWYFKVDVKTALHLKGFRVSAFFGSLFLVLGGLGMATWIGLVQVKLFPESVEIGKMIEELINLKSTGLHPVIGLLIVAISPAVCEEVLFRGMLLSSFRRTLSPAWAVVVVALLFGLFHVQVFRIVPTAFIGLYLTYIVYETGSIYLSVIGHALNNGIALMIISYPGLHRYLFWLGEEETMRPAGIGIVLFLAVSGVWLIRHSKRKENRS